jgi:micrococcal nuclease
MLLLMERSILVVMVLALATPAAAQWKSVLPDLPPWTGKVVKVVDGDTLLVVPLKGKNASRVRLFSVDCPELDQPSGREARRATIRLARGNRVQVAPKDGDKRTKLVIAEVTVGGVSLAESLLNSGFAWHLRGPAPGPELAKIQEEAKAAKRGLWAAKDEPVPPWKWRERQKEGVNPACYEKCLRKSSAQAVAWQAIQSQCRSRCPPKPTRHVRKKKNKGPPRIIEVIRPGHIDERKVK